MGEINRVGYALFFVLLPLAVVAGGLWLLIPHRRARALRVDVSKHAA